MTMKVEDIGRAVRETQYAVRGPIVARAQALERAGRAIIYCNIGNPQALGQRPLTWVRQVLALCEYPELLDRLPPESFPADAVEVSRQVLAGSRHGLGAYTDSRGYAFVREAVAEFIRRRDGIAADPEAIYLTDGASKAAQSVLRLLIDDARDGIMVPIPQYPLYSATITLYGGALVPYALDERSGWELSRETLERAYAAARERGVRPRAIVVINPGNPTGAVLHETNIGMVLGFAAKHGLTVLADEVYQENLYVPGDRFVSFAQVLEDRGLQDVSLFSFHSVSKGFLGECGHRGGYVELRNVPEDVRAELTKLQSVSLCANSVGQIVTYLMVRPPKPGDPSFPVYDRERREILDGLRHKARVLAAGLNAVPGIRCNPITGAMYAFPSIALPPGVTDEEYCMDLLEETGICLVPGTGFGQAAETWHFRTTILPPPVQIETVVSKIGAFHEAYVARRAAEPLGPAPTPRPRPRRPTDE